MSLLTDFVVGEIKAGQLLKRAQARSKHNVNPGKQNKNLLLFKVLTFKSRSDNVY